MKAVLLLSYLFPPRGGAGVQRAVKFVKYLPQFGWRPLVVAHGESADDRVTRERDESLLGDVPAEAVVRYTRAARPESSRLERVGAVVRHRLNPTDPMGWWVEPAVQEGLSLLRQFDVRAIVVTMSPFTAAEAGVRLKRLSGLPLVLDLRDPWAMDETRIYPTRWHGRRDWAAMGRALREADLVVMNTAEAAVAVQDEFGLGPGSRAIYLPNGYDGEDFRHTADVPAAEARTLRIVHTGQFHSAQAVVWDRLFAGREWTSRLKYPRRPINLWTRTPRYLLAAMERVLVRGDMRRSGMELVLVGELGGADRMLVENSAVRDRVRMLGYRSHEESVGWVLSADVLFLPLHTPLDGGPALVVPGKTYEYLGSGRPILAMGARGDMRQLVEECRAGFALDGDDVVGAADVLRQLHEAKVAGEGLVWPDSRAIERYERRELTRRLANELDRLEETARNAALRPQYSSP